MQNGTPNVNDMPEREAPMYEFDPDAFTRLAGQVAPDMRKIWEATLPKLLEQIDAQLAELDHTMEVRDFQKAVERLSKVKPMVSIEDICTSAGLPVDWVLGWTQGENVPDRLGKNDQLRALYRALRRILVDKAELIVPLKD